MQLICVCTNGCRQSTFRNPKVQIFWCLWCVFITAATVYSLEEAGKELDASVHCGLLKIVAILHTLEICYLSQKELRSLNWKKFFTRALQGNVFTSTLQGNASPFMKLLLHRIFQSLLVLLIHVLNLKPTICAMLSNLYAFVRISSVLFVFIEMMFNTKMKFPCIAVRLCTWNILVAVKFALAAENRNHYCLVRHWNNGIFDIVLQEISLENPLSYLILTS